MRACPIVWRGGVTVLLLAPLLACSESTSQVAGGAVAIEVTVTPTTQTLGLPVSWQTSAVGRSLSGTIVMFGDGEVDSFPALGAQTQELNDQKFYDSVGVFVVIARVEDQLQGFLEDTATVEIVPAS